MGALPLNTTLPGSLLLGGAANAQNDSYFYLRDNPQCSASPRGFIQQPNQPYMTPMMQQQRMQYN